MLSAPRGYLQSVEITQTPAHVFMACTEPLMVTRWYGPEATIEPHTGGAYRVRLRDGRVRDALIDVWEPGRRLRLIYLTDPGLPSGGPLVEDLMFDGKDKNTVVRVLGSGMPSSHDWDEEYLWVRRGWAYWLDSLKKLLENPPTPPTR